MSCGMSICCCERRSRERSRERWHTLERTIVLVSVLW